MLETMQQIAEQTRPAALPAVQSRLGGEQTPVKANSGVSTGGERLGADDKNRMVTSGGEIVDSVTRQSLTEAMMSELLSGEKESLSLPDFLVWTVNATLPKEFLSLLFQLCHVVLGLRPASRKEEGEIVRGWLHR